LIPAAFSLGALAVSLLAAARWCRLLIRRRRTWAPVASFVAAVGLVLTSGLLVAVDLYQAARTTYFLVTVRTGVALAAGSLLVALRLQRGDEERERFFALAPALFCVASFDGLFRRLNPAWERTLGFPLHELVGRPFVDFVHPDDRDATLSEMSKLSTGGVTVGFENRYRCKDGSYRWLLWAARPWLEDGLIYAAARDNTERRQAEESLRAAKEFAEAANQELEAFSYAVSHDLRAPLRSIDGFSQALLEDCSGALSAEGQDYLRRVRAAAKRMADLIDGLLDLSRLSRDALRRERVDLSALARGAGEDFLKRESGRAVDLVIGEGATVFGDPRLLHVALQNLLENAFKFTRTRPYARIEFGVAGSDGQRTFFVKDNGVGFDMAFASKLFDPFQRFHSSREFEGTGIGLATVKRIVHRHGGRIWAESAVDRGASFCFTL